MITMSIPTSILKPGMVVYEDIYNQQKILILNKDTTLDQWQIEKILANGIDKVKIRLTEDYRLYAGEGNIKSIYDSSKIRQFKEKYTEKVDEVTHIIKEIGKGSVVDVQTVGRLSKHIIKEFDTISDVINYLHFVKPMDDYTYSHSLNVSLISIIIARWLQLGEEGTDEIATAGLLHDIGKTKVPKSLLQKPGKLTAEEFNEIKKHTTLGYMMMDNVKDATLNMKCSALMHHEKIDGSGYPIGARDKEIPLFPKIIAIADIYDAMTSNRSYRGRVCPFEVIKGFVMNTFGQLDIKVLSIFLENIANSYLNDFVELNTGEICQIVFINPSKIWQPIVKFGKELIDLSCDNNNRFIKAIV